MKLFANKLVNFFPLPVVYGLKTIIFNIMNFSLFSRTSFIKYRIKEENIKLIMTLLVKNEEHIIEENLIFHHAQGIDGFIVTDNNSTDGTKKILEKYQQKGWILEIIDEPSTKYDQCDWVNRMIKLATDKYQADWVINCDADEFWQPVKGLSIKNIIKKYLIRGKNVLMVPCNNMVPPADGEPFWKSKYMVSKGLHNPSKYALSEYSLYDYPVRVKVIHPTENFISITQGNHNVYLKRKKAVKVENDIQIYHFNVQSYKLFEQKVVQGGKAYEKIKDLSKGAHWRSWYKLYQDGILQAEYDSVVGKANIDKFLKKNILVEAKAVYDFFKGREASTNNRSQSMVSVAMATYNGERFLAEQLDSILNQTYQNIELIVCDDGSKDDTLVILNKYAKEYSNMKVFQNEYNLGYIKNFEKAFTQCKGDYIAPADQDDVWELDKLEVLMNNIGDNSLIFSNTSIINEQGEIICASKEERLRREYAFYTNHTHAFLLFKGLAQGCTTLFTRNVLEQAFPFAGGQMSHDWWVSVVASYNGGLGCVTRPLIRYRKHDTSVTGEYNKARFFKSLFKVLSSFSKIKRKLTDTRERAQWILDSRLNIAGRERRFLENCVKYSYNLFNPLAFLFWLKVFLTRLFGGFL